MVPDDMALIKGSPQTRRQFLDYQIAQVDPLYVHHLTRYMRAMRQRNCLLRAKQHGNAGTLGEGDGLIGGLSVAGSAADCYRTR